MSRLISIGRGEERRIREVEGEGDEQIRHLSLE